MKYSDRKQVVILLVAAVLVCLAYTAGVLTPAFAGEESSRMMYFRHSYSSSIREMVLQGTSSDTVTAYSMEDAAKQAIKQPPYYEAIDLLTVTSTRNHNEYRVEAKRYKLNATYL